MDIQFQRLASGSFTQTAFDFAVTGSIVSQGLILALIVGFLGGVFFLLEELQLKI